jgi:hypothetical protein
VGEEGAKNTGFWEVASLPCLKQIFGFFFVLFCFSVNQAVFPRAACAEKAGMESRTQLL